MSCNAKKDPNGTCHGRLDRNVLLPNGELLLCCMDYAMKHTIGNILSESYFEILNSENLQNIRKALVYGNWDILCNHCKFCEELLIE